MSVNILWLGILHIMIHNNHLSIYLKYYTCRQPAIFPFELNWLFPIDYQCNNYQCCQSQCFGTDCNPQSNRATDRVCYRKFHYCNLPLTVGHMAYIGCLAPPFTGTCPGKVPNNCQTLAEAPAMWPQSSPLPWDQIGPQNPGILSLPVLTFLGPLFAYLHIWGLISVLLAKENLGPHIYLTLAEPPVLWMQMYLTPHVQIGWQNSCCPLQHFWVSLPSTSTDRLQYFLL